jgi:hypothetical protein
MVPLAVRGTTPIGVKTTPEEGYHFMADMTDKAVGWIGQQRALMPGASSAARTACSGAWSTVSRCSGAGASSSGRRARDRGACSAN